MTNPMVYLAGPAVFRPNAAALRLRSLQLCVDNGLTGLWPADNASSNAAEIFAGNLAMIDRAAAVVAEISPWRGPHCDNGTAWELGYAFAREKPIFGWSTDGRDLLHRMSSGARRKHDDIGNTIEDFGLVDNLMIASSLSMLIDDSLETAIATAAAYLWAQANG